MPEISSIRCFEGNAKPHEPFWRFVDAVEGGALKGDYAEPEMELYGYISEYSWYGDEITPKMFKDDLYRNGNSGPVTIRMNSAGGDVIAASVMRTIIQDYPGQVTVRIDGMAASAATVVALAGDRILMQDTAYFMIHDPLAVFMMAMLNIEELSTMVDQLKVVKAGIINAYEGKTGLSREKLSKMMTNETWMSAQEAKNYGFVDEVIERQKDEPTGKKKEEGFVKNAAIVNALRNYVNVPLALKEPPPCPPASGGDLGIVDEAKAQEIARLRAEVILLKGE